MRAYPRQVVNLSGKNLLQAIGAVFIPKLGEGIGSQRFASIFANRIGVSHAILVSSARFGLALVLWESGLKPGDEVILSTYTFHAMPNIIAAIGLKPVFVDIRETDLNMDPECVKQAITSRTKAIIATHIYGQPAEMKPLREIADNKGLFLIEDCAEATGAEYHGKPAGSIGDVGLFSFSMGKPLVGLGGGAITTSNQELADAIRTKVADFPSPRRHDLLKAAVSYTHIWLSSHPRTFMFMTYPLPYLSSLAGLDVVDAVLSGTRKKEVRLREIPEQMLTRFPEVNAKVLMDRLRHLDAMNQRRIEVAGIYNSFFSESDKIGIAKLSPCNKNIYNAYGIRVPGCDYRNLQRHLIRKGIDIKKRHMYVCSAMEMFREFRKSCPVAERIAGELLHLPINHYMGEKDATYIGQSVSDAAR